MKLSRFAIIGTAIVMSTPMPNRLKLAARGRPVADGWLRTRAAA